MYIVLGILAVVIIGLSVWLISVKSNMKELLTEKEIQKIELQNPQRVQRALEVFRISGRPISSFWAEGVHDGKGKLAETAIDQFPYQLLQYAVMPADRKILHDRIAKRFAQMLDYGLEQEVRQLYDRGDLHLDLPSMRCVGYRQMWQYFAGDYSYEEMVERGVIATRQLAKRQLTWLKGWPQLSVFDTSTQSSCTYTRQILNDIETATKSK